MQILAGSGQETLAQSLAQTIQGTVLNRTMSVFTNGEMSVRITDSVQGENVVVLASLSQPVDSRIIELLFLIDAVERAGAKECTVVIPWLGYSLQDKVFQPGQALSARVIADTLSQPFVSRVILCDLHNPSIAGFFSVPTTVISAFPLFAADLQSQSDWQESVVVAPDFGALKKSRAFAQELNLPLAYVEKSRDLTTGAVTAHAIGGAAIEGKHCVLIEDIINTGATAIEVSRLLKERGAAHITFYATHGLFVGDAWQKLEASEIDRVVVSNSVPTKAHSDKLSVLPLVEIIRHNL